MQTTDITVTRMIPAPAEEVFDLWMDPKRPGGPWYGAKRVIVNVAVDGLAGSLRFGCPSAQTLRSLGPALFVAAPRFAVGNARVGSLDACGAAWQAVTRY